MKTGAYERLPQGYDLYKRIDFTKDREALRTMVIWTIVATLAMILPMLFMHPIGAAFDMPKAKILFCIAAMIVGFVVYVFLHESVHGICMRIFTGSGASFGFDIKNGMAYASSTWFFKKWPYIIIAIAPVLVWGIIIAVLLGDVDEVYFWYLYAVQIFNITGAAGDIYVICSVARMPQDVLAHDSGRAMDFYLPVKERKNYYAD